MGKKRKTNPRRIPISKSDIDRNAIIDEATRDNVYYGWLLVVKAMCEQDGMTNDTIMDAWNMVNQMTSGANGKHLDTDAVSARAKEIMGFGLPYSISFSHIHSQVELDIVRRKIHVNAIYSAFFIICVAIEKLGKFTTDEIHRIFLCADLLQAEVEGGCNSYDNIAAELAERGIYIVHDNGSARLDVNNTDDGAQENESSEPSADV